MDSGSTLSNSRKVPPLPRVTGVQHLLLQNRSEQRPSIKQLNSFGIARNSSQTSLRSGGVRRRIQSMNQRLSSKEHDYKVNTVAPEYYHPHIINSPGNIHQQGSADAQMANELLKISREQNQNLKDQNSFLLSKIRQLNSRDKSLKDTINQYEIIISQLTEENEYLRKEVTELTQEAKRKVDQFGTKLALFLKERNSIQALENFRPQRATLQNMNLAQPIERIAGVFSEHMFPTTSGNIDGNWDGFGQYISNNDLNRNRPQVPNSDPIEPKIEGLDLLMEELNNQFEALIYSCRVEKSPEKRKQIRKRLVELTYKMRALGSK